MENIDTTSAQLIADSYKSYHHSVYLYIYNRIGKDEEAKDLSQDAFLRLMDYKPMLRRETVKHFLFAICQNLVTDYLRHFYKTQEMTAYIFDHTPKFSNDVESQIIADNLLKYEQERVSRLPKQRRKIYTMSRFEDKSLADMTLQLGISVRTVENHLFISRKEIREYMQRCI